MRARPLLGGHAGVDRESAGVEGVHRDPGRVRGLHDPEVARRLVELELLHAVGRRVRIRLPEVVPELEARRLREAARDVNEDLAALDSSELVDRRLHRVECELEVVLRRLRVLPDAVVPLVGAARVVDRLDDVALFRIVVGAEGGFLLDLLEDVRKVAPVVRELAPHLERAIERHDHPLDVALDVVPHELLDVPEDPVPVEGRDVEVVDEDHDARLRRGRRSRDGLGRRRRGRGGRRRLLGGENDPALLHRVKVRDGLLDPVLDHEEVLFPEARHPLSLRVGHDDVEIRHGDALARDEGN